MKGLVHAAIAGAVWSPTSWARATGGLTRHQHIPLTLERREESSQQVDSAAELCTTTKCRDYAKYILDSFSPNYTAIDPCTDFDKWSCDGWTANHQYRPEQSSLSVSSVLSDSNRDMLHAILEGQYPANSTFTGQDQTLDKANFDKMKTAYNTCMAEDKIKEYGLNPLQDLLDDFEEVFPMKAERDREGSYKDELTAVATWLQKNQVAGLLSSSPGANDMSPDEVIIGLDASEIQLPKAYYNKSVVLTNYTRAIAQMYQVLSSGDPIDESPIPAWKNSSLFEKAKRVVDFEKLIADKVAEPEVKNDIKYSYNLKTLGELDTLVPQISIQQYLKNLAPPGYPIDSKRTVIAYDIGYFGNLSEIIKTTSRQTLHDYFEWRLIITHSERLHSNYTAPVRRFKNVLNGKEPDASPLRWRSCISEVDDSLGHLLGAAYIQRLFTKQDKARGDQVINDVKRVFGDNLKYLDWMSNSSKAVAAEKVKNIIPKIGYQVQNPNEESPSDLNQYYTNLRLSADYFGNGQAGYKWAQNKTWHDLLKPTDRTQWGMTSPTVNAYFNPPLNEIVFPAGIMQPPFFNSELPNYVSYGGFGATAGHELTHGFDDNGSKYDVNGKYREWWDNETTAKFEAKTQCFVKQYNEYTVEGLEGEKVHVNGKLTLPENIADSGGLNAAFRAWKDRQTASGKQDPALPGLEKLTNEQLFFVSYGNGWCEKVRKEALLSQVLSDPHSPADKRILGPLANSADFKKAFNCPVKKATCDLW
ncbi:endothelin-converting enzyme [Microthyrium microscopicum]|uniref:Endothelin-converting enzyme n=1 Tax=Microthyrium microscopicum TaxID=703497 RepID=A0A6A6U4P6_9PEZI|nr:endothelin-converting enzyme [Microthyrium microscopicum]